MNEYIAQVFASAAVMGLCGMLAYKGNRDGTLRIAFSVLLIYVALLPLADMADSLTPESIFGDFDIDADEYGEEYKDVAEDAFVNGLRELICSEFSLSEENVGVFVSGFDFYNMRAERINVILTGSAAFCDYKAIERYVEKLGMGECEAEIEIG